MTLTLMMMNLSDCDPNQIRNLTDPVSARNALYSTAENIIIGIAMPCVLAIGLIANLAFLFVIYRVPYMRTTTNFYLAHLAVSDIVFITVAVLEKVFAKLSSPISGDSAFTSSAGCVCYVLTVYITYFASIGLITLVTVERYFALCSPARHRKFQSQNRTLNCVISNWCIGVIFAVCITLGFSKLESTCILWPDEEQFDDLPATMETCEAILPQLEYTEYIQIVAFPTALIGNAVMFWRIIKSLNDRLSSSSLKKTKISEQNRQARNQVAWMLVVNGFVFFVCHLPFNVLNFIELTSLITGVQYMEPDQMRIMAWVGRLTTFLNAALNPFIYTGLNRRYRQAYAETFKVFKCSCFKKKKTLEIFAVMNVNYIDDRDESPL